MVKRASKKARKTLKATEYEFETVGIAAEGLPLRHLRDANGKLDGSRLSPDEKWPEQFIPTEPLPPKLELAEIEYPNVAKGSYTNERYKWSDDCDCYERVLSFENVPIIPCKEAPTEMHDLRAMFHTPHHLLHRGSTDFYGLLIFDRNDNIVASIRVDQDEDVLLHQHLQSVKYACGCDDGVACDDGGPVSIEDIRLIPQNPERNGNTNYTMKLKLMLNTTQDAYFFVDMFALDTLLETRISIDQVSSTTRVTLRERIIQEAADLNDAKCGNLNQRVMTLAKKNAGLAKTTGPRLPLHPRLSPGESVGNLLYTLAMIPKTSNFIVRGIEFGPDYDGATLNNFLLGPKLRSEIFPGANDSEDAKRKDPYLENWIQKKLREKTRRSSASTTSADDWSISKMLEMASTDHDQADESPTLDEAERTLFAKLQSTLHPFQRRGIAFMRSRENATESLTLHPAWIQYVLKSSGRCLYAHKFINCLSRFFFPAPVAGTCGGMLCDDVGLGKSLQVLGHVLSSPPREGWAVDELPFTTLEPVAVKATLVVCPAALLDQWEAEIEKHIKPGAIKYCFYLGVKGSGKVNDDQGVDINAPRPQRKRSRPRRHGLNEDESTSTDQVNIEEISPNSPVEVLARLPQFFAGPHNSEPEPLAQCDLVLCSYETLREDIRKTNAAHSHDERLWLSTPLGAIGFHRLILDEAQLIAQSNSVAAIMCSSITRRFAWICTGTPVTRDITELRGLLAFLAVEPLAQKIAGDQLLIENFRKRNCGSRANMLSLLKGLMIRRGQRMPGIQRQIALPPCIWEERLLTGTPAERGAYKVAMNALKKSYAAYKRHLDAIERARREGRVLHSTSRAGGLIGTLNGDLTRLRQTICHPAVVNQQRDAAKNNDSLLGASTVLPMSTVLKRIVARAEREALTAQLSMLRAEFIYVVTALSIKVQPDETLDNVCSRFEQLRTAFLEKLYGNNPNQNNDNNNTTPKTQDAQDEMEHARKCEEAFDRLGVDIATFRASHPSDTMDYEKEIVMTGRGGGTLSLYWQQTSQTGTVDIVADDSDEDDEEPSSTRRRRGGGVWVGGDAARDKMAERVMRLVVKHGREEAVSKAKKEIATAAAACREKDSTRNYLFRELKEAEDKKKKDHTPMDESEDKVNQPNPNTCPMCMEERADDTRWSITKCGHSGCAECMSRWISSNRNCPLCKQDTTLPMLFIIDNEQDEKAQSDDTHKASVNAAQAAYEGDWGTKISAFLNIAGQASRNAEKVIVFSAWTRLLKLVASACDAHGITYSSLIGSASAKRKALTEFRASATILLVPLFGGASGAGGGGAAGLTLTHANTAIILEPALQPGIEEQAAGRISRIGQTKSARVIRLIVKDTIEPKILEWQQRRINDTSNRDPTGATLTLNDFVQLGIA